MVATLNLPFRVICDGLAFPEGPLELPGGDILVTEVVFPADGPNVCALSADGKTLYPDFASSWRLCNE